MTSRLAGPGAPVRVGTSSAGLPNHARRVRRDVQRRRLSARRLRDAVNRSGSALAYSTFLGGTGSDIVVDIAVERGRAHVTGITRSLDFPTTVDSFDPTFNGGDRTRS